MTTNAIPLSAGMCVKNCLSASRPPAEAPMPTTARGASSRPPPDFFPDSLFFLWFLILLRQGPLLGHLIHQVTRSWRLSVKSNSKMPVISQDQFQHLLPRSFDGLQELSASPGKIFYRL